MARLGDLYTVTSGGTPSRNHPEYYEDGTIPWVKTGDLKEKYLIHVNEKINEEGLKNSSARIYPKGTVLLAMYGATIGACSILKIESATNQACAAFVKNTKVLPEYLYSFLKSQQSRFIKDAVGGAQPNISAGYLKGIELPTLTLEQQNVVAQVLDKVDNLISLRKQQLEKLDQLVKSQFTEMFGDLGLNPYQWPEIPLVSACRYTDDIKCGPFGTQLRKDEYQSTGVPLWGIPQINAAFTKPVTDYLSLDKAEKLKAYSLIPGDIAMSRKGNVGMCAIYPNGFETGIMHSDVLRIRVDKERVNPCFIMYQLHISPVVETRIGLVSSGAIMAGINVGKLKNILIHFPPFDIQNLFATFVQQVEKSKIEIQQSLDKLNILYKSLMQQYFG